MVFRYNGSMVLAAPYTRKTRAAIDDAASRVEAAYTPDIIRIRHRFSEDSNGFPSIYFQILVRDEAGQLDRLMTLSRNVEDALVEEAQTDEHGLGVYCYFRTVSEQRELRDPAWE